MRNIPVYCVRCNGTGQKPSDPAQPCGLCKDGTIGALLAADVQAAVQETVTEMGIQVQRGPMTGEPL